MAWYHMNAAKILFKGVNVVEYCKCEGFSECSTQWDPYDGKSITQAQSDQYKVGALLFLKSYFWTAGSDSKINDKTLNLSLKYQ